MFFDCLCAQPVQQPTELTGLLFCDRFLCCCTYVDEWNPIHYELQELNQDGNGNKQYTVKMTSGYDDDDKTILTSMDPISPRGREYSYQSLDQLSPRSETTDDKIDFSSFDPELALIETMIDEFSFSRKKVDVPSQTSSMIVTPLGSSNTATATTTTTTTIITTDSPLQRTTSSSLNDIQIKKLELARKIRKGLKEEDENENGQKPKFTRSEITSGLSHYIYLITTVKEIEQKKMIIKEYEECKHAFDFDDEADTIHANHYLQGARNLQINGLHSNNKRIYYYQKAIILTHDLVKKNLLKEEYTQFCIYLSLMAENSLKLNKK